MRRVSLWAAALLPCVLAILGVTAPSVSAGSPGAQGLFAGPCNAGPSGYYTLTLHPGATYTSCVNVRNGSSAIMPIVAYAADGLTSVASGAVYSNQGLPVHGVGAWMTIPERTMTLAPQQQRTMAFTIHVPATATSGDHLGAIVVGPVHGQTSSGGVAITVVDRLAIAVLVTVPGPATLSFTLDNATIQPLSTTHAASVVVTLGNTGQLLGKPNLTVMLRGPGSYDHSDSLALGTMLPGDTIPYPFQWKYGVPEGHYRITVTAAWVVGATRQSVTRTFTTTVAAALPPSVSNVVYVPQAKTTVPQWVPVLIVVAALLLLTCGVAVVVLIRRQRAMAQELKLRLSQPGSGEGGT
ncbi:MAG: DUF916 domain-containing protein [Actinomycetota bacterium]|nr:DUF916 domain-containing protein [Actinomycetota bacterium]